jgi:hypothetical protein
MSRAVSFAIVAVALTACTRLPWTREPQPNPDEGLYYRALTLLDSSATTPSLDSAVYYLDRYLASSYKQDHAWEAVVLRRLVVESLELRRVQVALQRDSGRPSGRRTETSGGEVVRSDDASREIQRLKEELAKANAELERIRKRLANPRDP